MSAGEEMVREREDERGENGVEEEDAYLLVISAGFSLVPKDEFGLEPLQVAMDSNSR